MKVTIKNKLLVVFSSIIVITMLIQYIFNVFLAEELYIHYKKRTMNDSYYQLVQEYKTNPEGVEALAQSIEDTQSIRIEMHNDKDILYINRSELGWEMTPPVTVRKNKFNGIPEFSENPEVVIRGKMGDGKDGVMQLAGKAVIEDTNLYIIMTLPLASLTQSAQFFNNSYSLISLFVLVITILVSIRISRELTKPIELMEQTTRELEKMNFEKFIPEQNASIELSNLGKSINRMSQELRSRVDQLQELNSTLQADVDKQKQLEQMRREFVANVSHELKTPLAILQLYCENLKSEIPGIDYKYYYDAIIEETQRMDEMVKQLLEISSLENGMIVLQTQKINVSDLGQSLANKFQPLLQDYAFEVEITPDIYIHADPKYILQAMQNYLTNAMTHTKMGARITMRLEQVNHQFVYTVFNEGIAIPEQELDRIWESFYKSDQARERKQEVNIGMGLYIVQCIIDKHQGSYQVKNVPTGVEFIFTIPSC